MMFYDLVFVCSWILSVAGFAWFIRERETDSLLQHAGRVFLAVSCVVLGLVIFVKAMTHEYKLGIEKGREIYCDKCDVLK